MDKRKYRRHKYRSNRRLSLDGVEPDSSLRPEDIRVKVTLEIRGRSFGILQETNDVVYSGAATEEGAKAKYLAIFSFLESAINSGKIAFNSFMQRISKRSGKRRHRHDQGETAPIVDAEVTNVPEGEDQEDPEIPKTPGENLGMADIGQSPKASDTDEAEKENQDKQNGATNS